MKQRPKDCLIYTLDGYKPARASAPFLDYAAREVVRVRAIDKSVSVHVPAAVANSRFRGDEKPTFYAC